MYFTDIAQVKREVLWYENFDIENVVTPVNVNNLRKALKNSGFDKAKTEYLCNGFENGFALEYQGERCNMQQQAQNERFFPRIPVSI